MTIDADADADAVAAAAESLRQAMVAADVAALDTLIADAVSYGHSNGRVDTKAEIVDSFRSGRTQFVAIDIGEQTVTMVDTGLALLRHRLEADTNDGGKPGHIVLKVLLVWLRQEGHWRLVARQAVRPPR